MKPPPYHTFPTLESEGIILRAIQPSDIPGLVDISFYDGQQARSVEEALAMLEKINRDYAAGNSIHWGIEEQATGKLVGTCGYYRGFAANTGELGCVLLATSRGRGYMTRAMKAAIDFGQNEMGLERITAITTRQNSKAIQLLHRLGFLETADLERSEDVAYEYHAATPTAIVQ